jgi:transposase
VPLSLAQAEGFGAKIVEFCVPQWTEPIAGHIIIWDSTLSLYHERSSRLQERLETRDNLSPSSIQAAGGKNLRVRPVMDERKPARLPERNNLPGHGRSEPRDLWVPERFEGGDQPPGRINLVLTQENVEGKLERVDLAQRGKRTMPKNQRTFTREFEVEAVKLLQSSHKPLAHVARDLGIADRTLHQGRKLLSEQGEQAFPGSGHLQPQEEELRRVKRENDVLRQERDLLKRGMLLRSTTGNEQGYTG